MNKVEAFCKAIDNVNEWAATRVAWLAIPLVLIVTLDVALRYLFNKPTIWAYDISGQIFAFIAVMGGGYALLHGAHVCVDIFLTHLSKRGRAILDMITSPLFFVSIGVMLWQMSLGAWQSVLDKENSSSYFAPPIYPLKVFMAVGVLLLLLQGVAKFLRDLNTAVHYREVGNGH